MHRHLRNTVLKAEMYSSLHGHLFDSIRLVTVVYILQKLTMKNMSLKTLSDPETLCDVGKYDEHFFVEYPNQAPVVSHYMAAQKVARQKQ